VDRDFLRALAEPGCLVSPTRRDEPVRRYRARPLRDEWQKAVYRTAQRVALVQAVAPPRVLLAILPAQSGESELPQAQSLRVQQASRQAAPLQVLESGP
jgi:hypothetical protein